MMDLRLVIKAYMDKEDFNVDFEGTYSNLTLGVAYIIKDIAKATNHSVEETLNDIQLAFPCIDFTESKKVKPKKIKVGTFEK